MQRTVSVVIPTFEPQTYLLEAVDSVLEQTLEVLEIFIINDASEKEFNGLIEECALLSNKISVINLSSNRGVSYCRNLGAQHSNGEFVLFLDDDDLLHPNFLKNTMVIFDSETTVDVVFGNLELVDTESKKLSFYYYQQLLRSNFIEWEPNAKDATFFIVQCLIPHCFLFRKHVLEKIKFHENIPRGQDSLFWIELAKSDFKVFEMDVLCGFYRLIDQNTRQRKGYDLKKLYYNTVIESGVLTKERELAIFNYQLMFFQVRNKRLPSFRSLQYIIECPVLFARYVWFTCKIKGLAYYNYFLTKH
ncbi:MAG: glycosyltransferase family 2 protein [Cyclobacteriaceae bacterium]